MEDIKQAYERLGLEPFAEKDLVEKKYSTLLRKDRSRSKLTVEEQSIDPDFDFHKITEAYRAILDYETKKYTDAFEEQEYGKYKKMAGQAKKFDHFWRYYKIHTYVAIGLVIALIYGVVAFMDRQEEKRYLASLPPIDVQMSFLGNYFDTSKDDTFETTNAKLLSDFPDFQRVVSDIIYVPEDQAMQYAYIQKAFVLLMTESPDLYILDEPMFNYITPQGVLTPLEDVASLSDVLDSKYAVTGAITDDDGNIIEEHVYAIDLTESALGKNLPIAYPKLIVGIRVDAPHPEKALQFIETYAKTLPLS
ncbi:hypothetical protein [Paenibacillus endoradicis]|uniref:hypothetical protein n=1 Tax=Paenibacillus endoradicis TaxID=2972487 RepID=UPI0021598488|nr:hypothetical protein [Paenibacillus endoradicis]MCR8659078.1 hypothetical protein [Paenibacillus endoradicis]